MTTETRGIEIKNKEILILGIILLLIGLIASLYYESKSIFGIEYMRTYPYQSIGIVLVLVGAGFIALAFFYSPRKTEPTKQSN
jgi:nitric oxide reductase large subunit